LIGSFVTVFKTVQVVFEKRSGNVGNDLTLEISHEHNTCRYMFGHNSPADGARELFKPSNNAESLVVSI